MATTRTVTVKSSGGDYTSVATALSTETKDLVANDRVLVIEIYANAGVQSEINITGWTTDATRYLEIVAPVGERHVGVWDAAKSYFNATYASTVSVEANQFVKLSYLQVAHTRDGDPSVGGIEIYGSDGGKITITRPIVKRIAGSGSGTNNIGIKINIYSAPIIHILRPLIIDFTKGITKSTYATAAIELLIYNPTVIGHASYGMQMGGLAGSSYTYRVKNALIQGSGTDYEDAANSGAAKETVSILTQDASSPTVGLRSKTVTFVGSGDYTPDATDTAAKDAGTDLSADSYLPHSTDLADRTITGTWDVGALEYIAGGSGPSAAVLSNYRRTILLMTE